MARALGHARKVKSSDFLCGKELTDRNQLFGGSKSVINDTHRQ